MIYDELLVRTLSVARKCMYYKTYIKHPDETKVLLLSLYRQLDVLDESDALFVRNALEKVEKAINNGST